MLIKDIVKKYSNGNTLKHDADNLACQEIILSKIATSKQKEKVTLKGGIVLYNLSKGARPVTKDIDFDLIRTSIDNESLKLFVKKLNSINDGIAVKIQGEIEPLHQENYKGARINIVLIDKNKDKLFFKLDIGVHTYSAIEQEQLLFSFNNINQSTLQVNPPEQIFSEKLFSLANLGALSHRYKDVYDMYYLIKENILNHNKVKEYINLYLNNSKRQPNDISTLYQKIDETLNDEAFIKDTVESESRWIDDDYDVIKDTILDYVYTI